MTVRGGGARGCRTRRMGRLLHAAAGKKRAAVEEKEATAAASSSSPSEKKRARHPTVLINVSLRSRTKEGGVLEGGGDSVRVVSSDQRSRARHASLRVGGQGADLNPRLVWFVLVGFGGGILSGIARVGFSPSEGRRERSPPNPLEVP